MPVSRCGTWATSISMPTPPRDPVSRRRAGQARGAHVLHADAGIGRHDLEAGLEQQLLHERIADLHGRALLRRLLVELGRRHRRAVDAVAARLGADVVDGIADAARAALDERIVPGDAEAEHVHERIAAVASRRTSPRRRRWGCRCCCRSRRSRATTPCRIRRLRGSSSGPNRSESSNAIGRAPIVKMSRMMPPTPVAAPW